MHNHPQAKTKQSNNNTLHPDLRLYVFVIAAIADRLGLAEEKQHEMFEPTVLRAYRQTVGPPEIGWVERLMHYLDTPDPQDIALIDLCHQLDLSITEMLVVSLASVVEDSMIIGRILSYVQAPIGGSRPTLGLLSDCLNPLEDDITPLQRIKTGNALASGLLILSGGNVPLTEQMVQVPYHIVLALAGFTVLPAGAQLADQATKQLVLARSVYEQAQQQAEALSRNSQTVLVIRCASELEGKAIAALTAGILDMRVAFIEENNVQSLAPWLYLQKFLPVFMVSVGPGQRFRLQTLSKYNGPILVVTGIDGVIDVNAGTVVTWTITIPTQAEREELWIRTLGNKALAADLAQKHRHSSSRIAELAAMARYRSTTQGRDQLHYDDINLATWYSDNAGLDAYAQPVRDVVTDDVMILDDILECDLQALLARCKSRDGLADNLGQTAQVRYRSGVRALFVGVSGTGKTLAASWLATHLSKPLYKVDLASVTSKYVGETEKNLSQLLAHAEHDDVILLFDEADSIFGKRTDVNQANDRYANAQTNYLLQRMETYDGITILTSNNRGRFDQAFMRRLDSIIEFQIPGPNERYRLWLAHLGNHHDLNNADLKKLATHADFTGSHIRNVVFSAAVSAQSHGRQIIMDDVLLGVELEYRKRGKQVPYDLLGN